MKAGNRIRVLRIDEVVALTTLSKSTIWRMQKAGEFPEGIDLGSQARGYFEHEILEWLVSRNRTNKQTERKQR